MNCQRLRSGPLKCRVAVAILLLAGSLWLPGPPVHAANGDPVLRGLTLAEALQVLQGRGLKIIFSTGVVRADMRVEVEPRATWPREILDELLAPHRLQARPGPGGTLLVVHLPESGSIRGSIRNGNSRKPIADARVFLLGDTRETRSDGRGAFRLDAVPDGTYTVKAVLPGFFPGTLPAVTVRDGKPVEVRLVLTPTDIPAEEVVVTPNGPAAGRERPESGRYLGRDDFMQDTAALGDPFRTVMRQPGVTAADNSSQLHVRGGTGDEVMYLFDGLELYDPFHLQDRNGLLSALDNRTIGDLQFFGGAFPADYGGRMSGVIEIDSVNPADDFRTDLRVQSDFAGFSNEGSFRGGDAHWFLSGRRGDPARLLDALGIDDSYHPRFHDLTGNARFNLAPGTTLSLHMLMAQDTLERAEGLPVAGGSAPGTFRSRYDNYYTWVRLQSAWRPRWFSESILGWGQMTSDRNGSSPAYAAVVDNRNTDIITLKQEFAFEGERNFLRWGADVKALQSDYRYTAVPTATGAAGSTPAADRSIEARPSGAEFALFVADRIRLGRSLTADVGLRWDAETYTGSGDDTVSPRVNLAWSVGPRSTARAGWGIFHQTQKIHQLQIEDGIRDFNPVQRAGHFTLGFEHRFRNGLDLAAGVYRKEMSDLQPRFENLFFSPGFFPETDSDRLRLAPDAARAQGLELSVAGGGERLDWRAGYTLASVEEEFAGSWVPRSWDQRHLLDLGLHLRLGRKWNLAVAGTLQSGRPTTAVSAEVQTAPDGSTGIVPLYGPRNGERLSGYHRLDVRVDRTLLSGRNDLRLFVDIANLFDSDNSCCIERYDFTQQPDGTVRADPHPVSGLSRLITFGVVWSF